MIVVKRPIHKDFEWVTKLMATNAHRNFIVISGKDGIGRMIYVETVSQWLTRLEALDENRMN